METGPYFGRPRNSEAKGILAALPLALVHLRRSVQGLQTNKKADWKKRRCVAFVTGQ